MRALVKLIDAILFLFFILVATVAPIIDLQTILPRHFFPDVLVDFRQWFIHVTDDYLLVEKPSFYVGIVWLVVVFIFPLNLVNLYGLLTLKSWYPTTCLMFGVSMSTFMVAIGFEIMGSGKVTSNLKMLYFPIMGVGILATLRGLVPHSGKTVSVVAKTPAIAIKKRA